MSTSSIPRPSEEDLDFDDPPNFVKDEMQRAIWCISREVRNILQDYRDQEIYFCYHGGYCNFQTDQAFIDSHFNRYPGHRLSPQDRDEWRRLASERRRMRDDLRRRRRAEADRGWDHRRPPPMVRPSSPHGSERRGWSSSRDSPQRYRDRSRESPPPGYRDYGGFHDRSRSPPRRRSRSPYGHRSQSPPPGFNREGQRNSWKVRTPSDSPSPPPRSRSPRRYGSPKTRSYPPPPASHFIDREGDPRSSRSSPHHHRPGQFGSRSPPGSRSRNSPSSSSFVSSRDRSRESSGSSRPPPHRSYHYQKEYSHRPGVVGRFNSKKDPNYRDTEADDRRPKEWVCSDRGETKGCTRVFHVQQEYIEHIKVRKMAGNICPDRRVSRLCRDEGSIRGCGKEFNRLDAYQEHINIRNKTRDRRCPELGPEVRSREGAGVKAELRPGPLYTGDVVEVDIADSPEYVAPVSPVSPPSASAPNLVTPLFTIEKAASPDRSVSPPPCDPDNSVSVRDDGVILIQPSSLPDLVTSSNPGPSFKIRLPSRPVEKGSPAPPAGEPSKLDLTPVNRTGDSDVTPCTPLMGNVSSTMTGASPVAESTPKSLSVATAEKASSKEDVPVTHPTPVQDLVTDANAKCVQSDLSSVQGNIMSDKGPSSAKESEKEKRGKFKLPSCFADANEISSPSALNSSDKVSAKRKSQDDEMELLLDKKKRSQILKKTPSSKEQPSPKEPEVLTVSTSTSVDDSQEAAELMNEVVLNVENYLSSSSQKPEEINTSQPPKLSFGPPAASKKVNQKPTNTSLRENVPSKVSSSPEKTKKVSEKNKVKLLSKEKKQEKATVKASKKSEIVKPARKDSLEKSKKSHKRAKEKSNDNEPKLFETDKILNKSFKKPPLKTGNLLEEIPSKEKIQSKHVDESGKDQYNEEASLDDLLADDDEELEKERPNENEVTQEEVMERIEALFMSPESTKIINPTEDKDAAIPSSNLETVDSSNKEQNTDQSVREMVMQALEETNSSEDTGPTPKPMVSDDQTDYNLIKPEHLLPSESTVSPDKVVVKFSGEEAPEMVSIDPDDRDVDSSYEPPVKVTPNTSVSPLCKRIIDKESEVHFSREETNRSSEVEESLEKDDDPGHVDVEHSSERETEVAQSTSHVYSSTLGEAQKTNESSDVEESFEKGGKNDDPGNVNVEASSSDGETEIASEGPSSPSRGLISTLREALLDTDEDLEEETETEDDEDCYELVWGKDSCSVCPSCQKALTMKETNVSINLVDSSYIITCSSCRQKIVIRNLLSDRQKALLYSN